MKEIVHIYTDGSFIKGKARWAFTVINTDKELNGGQDLLHKASGTIYDEEINEGFQIGGECQAVIKALEWCIIHNKKAIIHFDLWNLSRWVADLFGGKPWKTNKEYTKKYRELVLIYRDYLDSFVKVKSHSGDKWSDLVDNLAKNAN